MRSECEGEGSPHFHWAALILQGGTWRPPGRCCLLGGGWAVGSLTVLGTVHSPRTEAGRKGMVEVKAAHSAAPLGEEDLCSTLSWRQTGPWAQGLGGQVLASSTAALEGGSSPWGEVCDPGWGSRGDSGVHGLSSCTV